MNKQKKLKENELSEPIGEEEKRIQDIKDC